MAPKALTIYATDNPNRPKKLEQYFTKDAKGLDVPVSDIQPQPAEIFTSYLAFGRDNDTAICNIWSDLESLCQLVFRNYSQTGAWKITLVYGLTGKAY